MSPHNPDEENRGELGWSPKGVTVPGGEKERGQYRGDGKAGGDGHVCSSSMHWSSFILLKEECGFNR